MPAVQYRIKNLCNYKRRGPISIHALQNAVVPEVKVAFTAEIFISGATELAEDQLKITIKNLSSLGQNLSGCDAWITVHCSASVGEFQNAGAIHFSSKSQTCCSPVGNDE